ncbi:CoA pyrophosphatase [Roseovarius sp. SCSIO 43702]|uniref:CoA pyrophosphatase n=1 Tax=Roseovarius sp. SCSIO 43702 TaxID=2823043 RepID=UPI001C730FCD|nr:CoA pyrophosphatase [Roseovarius sp. SCSIO 43702]QYX57015.1 CoA pyrophosphatase [Roseovarius sp. SCSIO 43702]
MSDPLHQVLRALERPMRPSSDFDLNHGIVLPERRLLRPAGVLVPIHGDPDRPTVILTKRSSALKHHPGQIAFPGGKQDEGDTDVIAAALREAREEIALDESNLEILGTMPAHETVTGFSVTPVVARVRERFDPVPEAGEVDEVFEVPLAHVLDCGRYRIEGRHWRGIKRHYYVAPFGPYYVWGATARMLRQLAEAVRDED